MRQVCHSSINLHTSAKCDSLVRRNRKKREPSTAATRLKKRWIYLTMSACQQEKKKHETEEFLNEGAPQIYC